MTIEYRTEHTIDGREITYPIPVKPDPVRITVTAEDRTRCKDRAAVEDLIAARLAARGAPMRVVEGEWRPEFGVVSVEFPFDEFSDVVVVWTP